MTTILHVKRGSRASRLAQAIAVTLLTSCGLTRPVSAQLQAFAPTVTPKGSTVSALEGSTSLGLTFFVTNNSEFAEYLTASCSVSGVIPSCDTPSSIYLGAGATTLVTVTYSTAEPGAGGVTLFVFGQGGDDTGWYDVNVNPRSYRVGVTPDGQAVAPAAFASTSQSFTVNNLGNATATYNLAVTCGPPAATNCSAPPAVTIAAGDAATVTVNYAAGRQGARGTIRLRASYAGNAAVQDDGSVAVTVGAGADAPIIDIGTVNPGTVMKGNICPTTPAGLDVEYECGALRIAHSLPTTRTLNRARTPALLYNSRLAQPRPIVRAVVTLPASGAVPQSVTARLLVNGVQRATGSWAGSDWSSGSARVIALSFDALNDTTGIYAYTFEVTRNYTSGPQTNSASSELLIINRKSSYFGTGWWLAGLERLVFAGGNRLLGVGGDGSALVYQPVVGVSNAWSAAGTDRPDTITYDPATTTYTRKLPVGVRVAFDRWGNHISTSDRRGHATTFSYTGDSTNRRLRALTVPGWRAGDTYSFFVGAAADRLDSVKAPAPVTGSSERVTRFTTAVGRIIKIKDPSADSVRFEYSYADSGAPNLVGARVDRRGTVTRLTYGGAWALTKAAIELDGVERIETTFSPQEIKGLAGGSAISLDSAYSLIDGPRSDVPDQVRVWANGNGSVTRIRNSLNHETLLTYGDGRFPGLVTELKRPNGMVSWAMYDRRGNLDVSGDARPLDDARTAFTTYTWDQTWDLVKRITAPTGEIRAFEYDPINGNRLWEEDARGGSNRTAFEYYSSGPEKDLLRAVVRPGGARDSVAYDTLGNLRASRTPLGNEVRYEADRVGRTIVVKTQLDSGNYAIWQDDSMSFDAMDRVTRFVNYAPAYNSAPAQRLILRNEYDTEGNPTLAERTISPEYTPTALGPITTRWAYDRAGRKIRETAPNGEKDSLVYDPAGNLTRWYTRRRDAAGNPYMIQMAYDTLNRLRERFVPQVRYPLRRQSIATLTGLVDLSEVPYDSVSIAATTTRFWYNVMGQLDSASNSDATVRRRYFPNGLIRHDSLSIRWYDTTSSNTHPYGLTYEYDLSGRRVALIHPNALAPRQGGTVFDRTSYTYDSITGFPVKIVDPLGSRFAFQYNIRDELASITYPFHPNGGTEQYGYDGDGRRATHVVAYGAAIRSTTYRYDARDKLLGWSNGVMMKDTVTSRYSGLGHLVYSRVRTAGVNQVGGSVANTVASSFTNDPLGNVSNATDTSVTLTSTGWGNSSSFTSTNWFARFRVGVGRLVDKYFQRRSDAYLYDAAGNVEFSYAQSVDRSSQPTPPDEDRASFYAADGQLRAVDYRWVDSHIDQTAENVAWKRVREYYRYDPLGRRILVRTLRTCDRRLRGPCRVSTIRRTVWDGDRELYEIQMPGDSTETSATLENDTAYVGDRVDWAVDRGHTDLNPHYGRVAYTNGLTLDQPLGLIRMQFANHPYNKSYQQWERFTVHLHWNARGEADLGSFESGTADHCLTFADGQRCVSPWWYKGYYAYQREKEGREHWLGTLVNAKEDGAGTLYRRNRHYDPQTGRFTQEDPIGLAGGMNLYGYAGGDPVNFSDPFGLCPPDDNNQSDCQNDAKGHHKKAFCPSGTAGTPPNCKSLATGAVIAGSCPNVSADEWDAGQQAIALSGSSNVENGFWFTNTGGARRAAGPNWVATPGTATSVATIRPASGSFPNGTTRFVHSHPSGGGISPGDVQVATNTGIRIVSAGVGTNRYGSAQRGAAPVTCNMPTRP